MLPDRDIHVVNSRSGSMSAAIWALLMVPDSSLATWTETIASAPAAKAAS